MPLSIDSRADVRSQLIAEMGGRIAGLSRFGENTPEYILADAPAKELSDFQYGALAAQLSSWINFAGGPITREKLERIYLPETVDQIDIPKLDSLCVPGDLDQLAAANGVSRDPGSRATGEVLISLAQPGATVQQGTLVGTQPDGTGDYYAFEVAETTTADTNAQTASVPIRATERGSSYNVGSSLITYVPNQTDVNTNPITSVTNAGATSGGENEEGNESLRKRAKNAIVSRSGGGTTEGIEGVFITEFDGVTQGDVRVIQHYDGQPQIPETGGNPYGEVLINAPQVSESELTAMFERDDIFPCSVYHAPLRPTRRTVDVTLSVTGTGLEQATLENAATRYLSGLTLGVDVADSKLEFEVIRTDADAIIDADATFVVDGGTEQTKDIPIGPKEVADPGAIDVTVSDPENPNTT